MSGFPGEAGVSKLVQSACSAKGACGGGLSETGLPETPTLVLLFGAPRSEPKSDQMCPKVGINACYQNQIT